MNDPIVDEVHATRQRLVGEFGGGVEGVLAWLRSLDSKSKSRIQTIEAVLERAESKNGQLAE